MIENHRKRFNISTAQRKRITAAYVKESMRKITVEEMLDLVRQVMTSRMNRMTELEFITQVEAFEPSLLPCQCDDCVEDRAVKELVELFRKAHS